MPHVPENDVQKHTEAWLERYFQPAQVQAEYALETGRRADFFVNTPFGAIVVEVENNLDSAAKSQVQFYRGHAPDRFLPVLVLDTRHAEESPKEFQAVIRSVAEAGGYVVTLDTDRENPATTAEVHTDSSLNSRPF